MSCAYTYAITTPMKCAFGIATQIEHHNGLTKLEALAAFEKLKDSFRHAPLLLHFDFTKP